MRVCILLVLYLFKTSIFWVRNNEFKFSYLFPNKRIIKHSINLIDQEHFYDKKILHIHRKKYYQIFYMYFCNKDHTIEYNNLRIGGNQGIFISLTCTDHI